MSVATHFYRLKAGALAALAANPELMDWLLGCSEAIASGERLGFQNGDVPPALNIGQTWDDILTILRRNGHEKAGRILDAPVWEDFDGFEEIRLYLPAEVDQGSEILEKLDLESLRAEIFRFEPAASSGKSFESLPLDEALDCLAALKRFWREAAKAGEGIVSSTG